MQITILSIPYKYYKYPPIFNKGGRGPGTCNEHLVRWINDDIYFIVCPQLVMFEYSEAKVYSTFDETHPRVFSDD